MSHVVALVQARMGSTRFPGKMVSDLGGRPVLEWVLQRTKQAKLLDKVVLATTDLSRDDVLEELAKRLDVAVFRGSESDVLGRFAVAANLHGADVVVRICADNPFIDAREIDRLVEYFENIPCDYACNHQDRLENLYADGFGAEILSNALLQRIARDASNVKYREHATSYIWDNHEEFIIRAVPAPKQLAYPELRFDVDTAQDLDRLKELVSAGVGVDAAAPEIVRIALNHGRAMLVTTDVEKSPVKLDNTYFLGAWCFASRHEESLAQKAGRILPYHWDDRDKLKKDFQYLQEVNDELINELMSALNKLHGINESKKFWRLLLGYWLNVYTTVIFDRWESLAQAIKLKSAWEIEALPWAEDIFASTDTGAFIREATESSRWNEALFALLIEHIPEIRLTYINRRDDEVLGQTAMSLVPLSMKENIKKWLSQIGGTIKSRDKFFLTSTSLPTENLLKLEASLGQFPLGWTSYESGLRPIFNSSLRKWRVPICPGMDKFGVIVRELLPKFVPRIFVEGFQELMSQVAKQPWPTAPDVIFTSNQHFADDLFKAWAAKKITEGARLVVGEHGGMGVGLFNGAHAYELMVADSYLTTGWVDLENSKVVPVGNFRTMGTAITPNRTGPAVMVCVNMPRFAFDIRSMALSSQQLDYFDDQFSFIDALQIELRSEILVRLYQSDYGWQQKERWLDRHPSIAFDENYSMQKSLKRARLFIGTYAATTYVDTLAMNFPTVIFWNPRLWEIKIAAKPIFAALKMAGIFHDTPESAASHVSKIWDNIPSWWQSEQVQNARDLFCEKFSSNPINLLSKLKEAIRNEAGNSMMDKFR